MKSEEKSWISTTPTGEQRHLDDDTKLLVNMVFARFKAIYGHKFDSTYGDKASLDIARREWGYCLIGYSEAQLAKALHTCKLTYAWPPSIAEFVALLQPSASDLGVVSAHAAYQEACRCRQDARSFPWSHPIVYHAARETGFWRLQRDNEKTVWPLFERTYHALLTRLSSGESFTIPDTVLLEDKQSLTQAETIQALSDRFEIDASTFYYLTLARHSSVRQRLRTQLVAAHPDWADSLPE